MTMHTMQDIGLFDIGLASSPGEMGPDSRSDLLALLVDELAYAVLIVSKQGQILHANQAASRELELGGILTDKLGELALLSPSNGKAFQVALGEALIGKRSLIKLFAHNRNVAMAVIPLKPKAGALCERIALFLSRADVCESGLLGSFSHNYGLTPTEQQVLIYLCRCLSTPEISRQMNVAVSTVRTHVRSLCAKTNSCGVRELIRRVAILPPIDTPPLGPMH